MNIQIRGRIGSHCGCFYFLEFKLNLTQLYSFINKESIWINERRTRIAQ
jgi:hypothetical protein